MRDHYAKAGIRKPSGQFLILPHAQYSAPSTISIRHIQTEQQTIHAFPIPLTIEKSFDKTCRSKCVMKANPFSISFAFVSKLWYFQRYIGKDQQVFHCYHHNEKLELGSKEFLLTDGASTSILKEKLPQGEVILRTRSILLLSSSIEHSIMLISYCLRNVLS